MPKFFDIFELTVFLILIVILIGVAIGMSSIHSENLMNNDVCKSHFIGYKDVYVDDIKSNIEPGYLKCCWTSYINHEAIKSCEIIKK